LPRAKPDTGRLRRWLRQLIQQFILQQFQFVIQQLQFKLQQLELIPAPPVPAR
jgi:hypothetical protein